MKLSLTPSELNSLVWLGYHHTPDILDKIDEDELSAKFSKNEAKLLKKVIVEVVDEEELPKVRKKNLKAILKRLGFSKIAQISADLFIDILSKYLTDKRLLNDVIAGRSVSKTDYDKIKKMIADVANEVYAARFMDVHESEFESGKDTWSLENEYDELIADSSIAKEFLPQLNKFIKTASRSSIYAEINGVSFDLLVARTSEQKAKGLEVVSSLQENEGMYFLFEKSQHVTFHMGGVRFPIDILFLDDLLRITKVVKDAKPGTKDTWSAVASTVIELPGGSCDKYNISVGDTVSIAKED